MCVRVCVRVRVHTHIYVSAVAALQLKCTPLESRVCVFISHNVQHSRSLIFVIICECIFFHGK